jgi:hypothetical protein
MKDDLEPAPDEEIHIDVRVEVVERALDKVDLRLRAIDSERTDGFDGHDGPPLARMATSRSGRPIRRCKRNLTPHECFESIRT